MKTTHYLALALGAALVCFASGCGDKSTPKSPAATNSSTSSPLTAPVDYLGAVAKAQQTAGKVVDTASINQAIQMFRVDKDRYPKDLDELVQEKFLPALPTPPYGTKLSYDAKTGQVKVVKE